MSKDVKRGVGKKLKDGGHSGVAPPGYINNTVLKTIEKDPERFEHVKSIFEKYLEGYTIAEIKVMLDEKGYKSIKRNKVGGGPLSRSSIYKILVNPRYYGRIPHPDYPNDPAKMYVASYPRMISRDQFERVQNILGKKGRTRYVSKKVFELKGLLVCGECSCSVTAERKSKRLKNSSVNYYNYYHCTHKREYCTQRGVTREQDLFDQIDSLLNDYSLPTDLYEWGSRAVKIIAKKEAESRNIRDTSINDTISQIEAKMDKLIDMLEDGIIDKETYTRRYTKLKNELEAARSSHAKAKDTSKKWYELVGKTVDSLHNASIEFRTGDILRKRDILLAIGYNSILKDNKVSITPYEWLEPLKRKLDEDKLNKQKVITKQNSLTQSVISTKKDLEDPSMSSWLSIKNDYRTLIGVDSLDIIEKEDDDEDEENSDV